IRILNNDVLVPRFLYYLLSTDAFFAYDMQHSKGAKMPRGDKTAIMLYTIPLPSLEEQARIVAILDRFDALCNDLTQGLPAEIEARRKQYEYYRDRLLTFEEATS
ncbi:MAG: restriction endonuclease subunit S, partial [Phototrophicaceae bacterium]